MNRIPISIESSRPIFIEADASNFGEIFANMSSEDQVNVFRSMVEHMKPHRTQWDFIAFELRKDENRQVCNDLSVIFPEVHEVLEENVRLRAASASGLVDILAEIRDAIFSYCLPQTSRGEDGKADLIRRADDALDKALGRP